MPTINANGINLYYEMHGQGKPLVLVAGFTCDTSFWIRILRELQAHFQLIIFDNRGAGRSESPDKSYTIDDMAKDTIALVEKLGIKKPHILGHSMGGCVVQTIALTQREMFDKIVISNSVIKMNNVSSLFLKFMLKLRLESCSLQTFGEGFIPWIFSTHFLAEDQRIQEVINLQINQPYPQSLAGYKRQLEALLGFDSSNWYKKLKGPALIISGDEDILCPRDSELLANHIENAKFVEFHRVAHCPMIEKAQDYVGILTNYLK